MTHLAPCQLPAEGLPFFSMQRAREMDTKEQNPREGCERGRRSHSRDRRSRTKKGYPVMGTAANGPKTVKKIAEDTRAEKEKAEKMTIPEMILPTQFLRPAVPDPIAHKVVAIIRHNTMIG